MMSHNQHLQTPFASARGYIVPGVSLAMSLPTLALDLVLIAHAITGYTFPMSAVVVQLSPLTFAFGILTIVFGPILGGILCITQRTYAKQTYGSVHLLGFSIKRWNTIALYLAALAFGLLVFAFFLTILRAALTPSGPA